MPVTPGIITWNRLEPRPRTEDFDRTLRAEVRDALWMMTRQWQFGEFQAEDTGTAIFSQIKVKTSQVNKIKLGTNAARDISAGLPIEADVEKETLVFDFLMRLEMGRYWEKLIKKRLKKINDSSDETIAGVISDFRNSTTPAPLKFELPADGVESSDFYSNPELWHSMSMHTGGKGMDGYELYKHLLGADNQPTDFVTTTLTAGETTTLDGAKMLFVDWLENTYAIPGVEESAWKPNQLEYQFALSATQTDGSGSDALVADEYYHGSLDWYAFDWDLNVTGDLNAPDSELTNEEKFTLIPTYTSFPGMPHPRWWQMEDQKVDLGDVNPSTSDMAKIVYAEFGLVYSNDWTIFPYTVPAGSVCDLQEIIVTDCFGNRTKVVPANSGDPEEWKRWSFFNLSNKDESTEADTRLFIPAVSNKVMESNPVEEVQFIRDEMANMVWGIEKVIPNGLSGGMDGYEAALQHVDFLKSKADPVVADPDLVENNATISYRLSNTVPENWIPFTPAKTSDLSRQIQLQRSAMPRFIDGLTADRVRPRTDLLKVNHDAEADTWSKYFIHEDEIPRAGVIVKKTWQRTRTEDGSVVVWLGKQKITGRGEGTSNLQFDQVENKPVE